ncbi:LysR family transcriptional regulator [Alteromonas sp. C1M14]|uniref:LysR family transcriptional regulator n=1 Tax=Alteromonas sp. C1M14 TaxID=2841567 RepID=UPI001C0817B4|nr:LysR family transcriptional regulator [Alteromonas sp. C1M14]MBU2979628.1 LysR family transcriptional regulator [Alteromonas sp. C1M14]
MNWDDLRLFLVLARNGRVGSAAKGAGIDPTTLIRRVKRLEDGLNCTLFELTKKGYVLTNQGTRLVAYIEQAEPVLLQAKSELSGEREHLAGTIRVSVSEGFGTWFLAPLLADFKRRYPAITIELVASSGFLNLNKREADMAILLEKPTNGHLYTQRLTDYELYLYCHKDLLNALGTPTHVRELDTFNLVSYVPDLLYAPQLKFIEESVLSDLPAVRSTSINAQYQMLLHGAGVGILPAFMAEKAPQLTRIVADQIRIKRTFWLATHKETHGQARFDTFVDWLTEQVRLHREDFIRRQ